MSPEIKVIHVEKRIAKNGNEYSVIWCAITIDGRSYVRKFISF